MIKEIESFKRKCPRCNIEAKLIKRNLLEAQLDDGTEVIAKAIDEYECPNCEMTIKITSEYNYYDDDLEIV
ncbi:MAG: hypothetical protein K6G28_04640 [Acholeplasmatales bacterium]|nr:hypothetical protein [Acholeplasmatales bacterium]